MVSPTIIGRYAIYDEIAAGGMATVHFGRLLGAAGFSRTVAIKRLHPQFAKDPEFVAMFLDEARLAARVRHPNVVATLDVIAKNGELFLVMDYVLGDSLSRLWRAAGKDIPLPIITAIMGGALHGLHAAHEATGEDGQRLGLVHRDISPQNILVGVDGVSRVLDFGVAKALGRTHTTRDGQIKGKLAYMAPEQLRGISVSARTDIYAAAVVLWETLTGKRLFQADTEAAIVGKIVEETVAAPSTIAPSIPQEIDALVLKGLAKNPDKRFATAEEMAGALERCVRPALPSEVRAWVQQWAGDQLQTRIRRVAEIERSPSPAAHPSEHPAETNPATEIPPSRVPVGPAGEVGSVTNVSVVTEPDAVRPSSRRVMLASVVGLAAVSAVVIATFVRHGSSPSTVAAQASATIAVTGAPSGSVALPPVDPVSASPSASSPAAPVVSSDSQPSSRPVAHPPAHAPRGKATAAPSKSAASPSDRGACYTLDSNGIWHIKPECL